MKDYFDGDLEFPTPDLTDMPRRAPEDKIRDVARWQREMEQLRKTMESARDGREDDDNW